MSTSLYWSIKPSKVERLPIKLKWALEDRKTGQPSKAFIEGFYYGLDDAKEKAAIEVLLRAMEDLDNEIIFEFK